MIRFPNRCFVAFAALSVSFLMGASTMAQSIGTPRPLTYSTVVGALGYVPAKAGNALLWSGTGVPDVSIGSNGDFYIDSAGFKIYGPKRADSWGAGTSMLGDVGLGAAGQVAGYASAGTTLSPFTLSPSLMPGFDAQVRTSRLDQMASPSATLSMGSQRIADLREPASAQDAATKGYVDLAVRGVGESIGSDVGTPTGAVLPFAGSVAPNGWFLCAGQPVSRTAFPSLFAAIGTTYGAGDGATTFNLPDVRGRIVAGADNMGGVEAKRLGAGPTGGITGVASLAASGGEQAHRLIQAEQASMPVSGSVSGSVPSSGLSEMGNATAVAGGYPVSSIPISASLSGATASGGGGVHNVVQPTIVLNYIIKQRRRPTPARRSAARKAARQAERQTARQAARPGRMRKTAR